MDQTLRLPINPTGEYRAAAGRYIYSCQVTVTNQSSTIVFVFFICHQQSSLSYL